MPSPHAAASCRVGYQWEASREGAGSWSSELPACGGLGAHHPPPPPSSGPGTFPGRAGKGAQAWPRSGRGHPAKATRPSVALSAAREEQMRFQATIKHQGGRAPCPPPTVRVPPGGWSLPPAQPSARPTHVLPFPHQHHSSSASPPSSLPSVSSSRTSAAANFTPAPRWGPPRATRHGEETQSVCGPSDKPLPRPPERRRPAGGQHTCAHVHTHR